MSPSKIPCSGLFNCLSGQRLADLSVSQRLLRPAATDGGRSLDPLRPGKLSERAFHGLSNRLPHARRHHFAPGSRMGGQGLFSFCGTSHHAAGRSQPSLSRSALSERCARGLGGRVALVECLLRRPHAGSSDKVLSNRRQRRLPYRREFSASYFGDRTLVHPPLIPHSNGLSGRRRNENNDV